MKHIWIVIAAAALASGCAASSGKKVEERATVDVATAAAELTELASSTEAGGVVHARLTALVASRVMAPIVDVRVRAGDRVRRGDVLVTLDGRELRAESDRARASAVAATETVRAAEADVRATESAVQLARLTHDRIATLEAKRSATAEELDRARAARSSAESAHAAAQARLAAAVAGRDAATAAGTAAAVTATYGTLTAPFDGLVIERSAEPGSMAAPGAPLLVLEDPTSYQLEVRLDESRAALVRVHDEAAVRLEHQDGPLAGRIVEIARVDPMSHSFLVKIALPPPTAVRSGQFGRATFTGPARRALTVPSSALVRRGQLTFVFVADAERRLRLRPVSVAPAIGDRIEVLAGLHEGERVVTAPSPALADGDSLRGARP